MKRPRSAKKRLNQSRRKNRYSLEERHRRGISATARAAAARAAKAAKQQAQA
jgi:hypothetical protein